MASKKFTPTLKQLPQARHRTSSSSRFESACCRKKLDGPYLPPATELPTRAICPPGPSRSFPAVGGRHMPNHRWVSQSHAPHTELTRLFAKYCRRRAAAQTRAQSRAATTTREQDAEFCERGGTGWTGIDGSSTGRSKRDSCQSRMPYEAGHAVGARCEAQRGFTPRRCRRQVGDLPHECDLQQPTLGMCAVGMLAPLPVCGGPTLDGNFRSLAMRVPARPGGAHRVESARLNAQLLLERFKEPPRASI